MNIFIGSSREASEVMDWVSLCLEENDHTPIRWDTPGLFPPGVNTFQKLIEISQTVEGAIFIFAADDKVWYRGDGAFQPRDNVLIEFGLFAGQLGMGRAIICMHGKPRQAADLLGIQCIDVSEKRRERARHEIRIWGRDLSSDKHDPATLQLMAKVAEQDKKLLNLQDQLSFEQEKGDQLTSLLSEKGVIDLRKFDLSTDGHWKLLFEFKYFWAVSNQISSVIGNPAEWRLQLRHAGANQIVDMINWEPFLQDPGHNSFFVRKALRIMRRYCQPDIYNKFLENINKNVRREIENIALDVSSKLQQSSLKQ